MIVMKFGGTSVGNADAIKQVADIVKRAVDADEQVIVVSSAMTKVTDMLIEAARRAETQNDETHHRYKEDLLYRHRRAMDDLVKDEFQRMDIVEDVELLLEGFDNLCHAVYVLGELTPRGLDAIVSLGERMAIRLVAARLNESGVSAAPIEATELIVTDDNYTAAIPLMEQTREKTRTALMPLLEKSVVPVVTGFIGATENGIVTTLGRGGSDYTAAIIGAALDSDEIWIWSDVDGVMTTDPRVVPEARTLPEISYGEAAELSYFGAKVLHPKTILPAIEQDIPIWIKNTFNPDGACTLVTAEAKQTKDTVKAITAIKGLSIVTVEGRGMMGVPGIAAKVFTAVANEGISVLMISQSSSEQSICFVISTQYVPRALQSLEEKFSRELMRHNVDKIWAQDDVAVIAVVGVGMKGVPGISARVFGAMAGKGINVISIAQGSSEHNISFVIAEREVPEAVRQLHAEFELGGE